MIVLVIQQFYKVNIYQCLPFFLERYDSAERRMRGVRTSVSCHTLFPPKPCIVIRQMHGITYPRDLRVVM